MIKAVVFDFDGVVADTMNDNLRAWQMAFKDFGIHFDPIEYFLLEGMGRFDIALQLSKVHTLSEGQLNEVVHKKETYYKQIANFVYFKEIKSILQTIQVQNKLIGLVTGASKARIQDTLSLDVKSFFNVIITVDDVSKGKPDPEPYLLACRMLDVEPKCTLVIENAQLGIQSAKSAGCICYAIETTLPKKYLQNADKIFANHQEVHNSISQL